MNRRTWCLTYPDGWVAPGDVFHGSRIIPTPQQEKPSLVVQCTLGMGIKA